MDLVVAVDKAVFAHLRSDVTVTSVIPLAQVYRRDSIPALPPIPFLVPGTPISAPFTGHRRRRSMRYPVYIRADQRGPESAPTELAGDHMGRCVEAVTNSLYKARLTVPGGTAHFELVNDIRRKVDGEKTALEANIEFRVVVMAG